MVFPSVVHTMKELYAFTGASFQERGDPCAQVCQMLVPWNYMNVAEGNSYFAEWKKPEEQLLLMLLGTDDSQMFPLLLPVTEGEPEFDPDGGVARFRLSQIAPSVWVLEPSLRIPQFLHAFVVLYAVPEPAPWQEKKPKNPEGQK